MKYSRLAAFLFCVTFAAAVAGAAFLFLPRGPAGPGDTPETRFFRAVHVLASLYPPAAEEKLAVPLAARRGDEVESLLHHPDKVFVLHHLQDEFAALGKTMPQAILFEGHARAALGDKKGAAVLFSRYVCETPYKARHYALLCRALLESGNYADLLLICREWREKEPGCRTDRALFEWTAQMGLERFAAAGNIFRRDAVCLGAAFKRVLP